ncbi:MAG: gliding motility-associated C-terminal domain-containing protein [Bacteroidia bacterium]|nr:gliding motility-associated C-terminal domain-containing protein [Bacteroidia bacterium]
MVPDTGKVTASYNTAVLHQEHLIPGFSELFFTNTSVGGKRYEWHFGDGSTSTAENPSHIYTSLENSHNGCFYIYLIAWSKEECEDWSDSGLVCLEPVSELIVPNIFSPNGDEKNDYFQVSGKTLKSFHGIITNRWGKTLFEWGEWDKKKHLGWDGKLSGTEASPGVYYYIITAEGWDNIKYDLKGAFHLAREK